MKRRFLPCILAAAYFTGFTPVALAQNQELSEASGAASTPDSLKPVVPPKIEIRDIDPALWVIRDDDTTIYLFGTVHALRPGLGWFDDAVKEAFDASDTLVLEVVEPPAGELQSIFAKYALAQDGIKLRKRLSGKALTDYTSAMKSAKLPLAGFDPLDPWAAAVTLQLVGLVGSGYDPNRGVETLLEAAAKARGMEIDQVETVGEQLGIFDNISMPVQVDFLNQTTADLDGAVTELDRLVDAWGKGDTQQLGQMINEGFNDPELYNALLTKRNANWARWIDQRMDQPGTVFFAVGAGHLAGGVSLQNLLGAYGIKAERISY